MESETLTWAREMFGLNIGDTKDEQILKGLQSIRKLDLILARKTAEYKKMKRARLGLPDTPEKPVKQELTDVPKSSVANDEVWTKFFVLSYFSQKN